MIKLLKPFLSFLTNEFAKKSVGDIWAIYVLPTVSSILILTYMYLKNLFAEALKTPILSQENTIQLKSLSVVLTLLIPLILIVYSIGYRFALSYNRKRIFKFFKADEFLWKFMRKDESVDLAPYCPKHKYQMCALNNPPRYECPACKFYKEFSTLYDSWLTDARAKARSFGISWKYHH